MEGTPALERGDAIEYRWERQKKGDVPYHTPQSVVRRTNCWGAKNSVMLHPEAGYAAVGIPNVVVSMFDVDVADAIDAGISGRCRQKRKLIVDVSTAALDRARNH
jgi:hypothetical protein